MKKKFVLFVFSTLFCSFLFAYHQDNKTSSYGEWNLYVKGVFAPSFMTGGSYIAQNDYEMAYYEGLTTASDASASASFFDAGFSFGLDYYFGCNIGLGLNFTMKFNSGLTTQYETTTTQQKYYRNFTAYEISPLLKFAPLKTATFYLEIFAGPVFILTSSSTKSGWSNATSDVERLQNLFIMAGQIGTGFGFSLSDKIFALISLGFEYDFTKTYNEVSTSEWFSKVAGNSFSIPVELGLALHF